MPLIGGPIGAILYDICITPGLNAKVAVAEKRPVPAAVAQGQVIPVTGEKKE